MHYVLCCLLCRTTVFYDNILVASDDYSGVSYTAALLCGDTLNVQDWKLWSTMFYGPSFWGCVGVDILVVDCVFMC